MAVVCGGSGSARTAPATLKRKQRMHGLVRARANEPTASAHISHAGVCTANSSAHAGNVRRQGLVRAGAACRGGGGCHRGVPGEPRWRKGQQAYSKFPSVSGGAVQNFLPASTRTALAAAQAGGMARARARLGSTVERRREGAGDSAGALLGALGAEAFPEAPFLPCRFRHGRRGRPLDAKEGAVLNWRAEPGA